MEDKTESLAMYMVEFSHWRSNDGSERRVEMYLHSNELKSISDIDDWLYINFGGVDIEDPIIWGVKHLGYAFSLDKSIDEQDY